VLTTELIVSTRGDGRCPEFSIKHLVRLNEVYLAVVGNLD
jgi:hypothetical protein